MKKISSKVRNSILIVCLALMVFVFAFFMFKSIKKERVLDVYNWGAGISNEFYGEVDINEVFTKKTGIRINYTTYQSNEEMYSKLVYGGSQYDIVVPSDYMVSKLRKNGAIQKIDFKKILNYKFINAKHKNLEFDPENEYCIPYMWGLLGIFYNNKYVKDENITWDILWDEKYSGRILFLDNPRDAMSISMMRLKKDINSDNLLDWQAAYIELKKQKHMIQNYVMDQIFDKMNIEEAVLAPFYCNINTSGMITNSNVKFAIPYEGTNKFLDCICIPKGAKHIEEAYEYINFLCEKDIGIENIKSIGYLSPQIEVEEELAKNPDYAYVKERDSVNAFIYEDLGNEMNKFLEELWVDLKINNKESFFDKFLFISILICLMFFHFFVSIKCFLKNKINKL